MEIYDSVFPEYDLLEIFKRLERPKWRYGHGSNQDGSGIPFWIMELNDEPFFTEYLLNMIRDLVDDPGLQLENVYANGHVFGDKGMPHVDSHDDDGRTFLFYANRSWDPIWGGKTCFLKEDNTYEYVNPRLNRAVYFPGKILHYAEEVSRLYSGLRVTIAWKLNGAEH